MKNGVIKRIRKEYNFTIISNIFLRDMNISLEAKGAMCMFLSLPDNWSFSISGLEILLNCKRTKVVKVLKELENYGYHKKVRISNRFYEYQFYEESCLTDIIDYVDEKGIPKLFSIENIEEELRKLKK